MQPEIHIGPLTLQTFGICFALAFVVAGLVIGKRLREQDRPIDWAYEIVFAALIGGIIGARFEYLIENWSDVSDDLLGNVFSGSGLVWYGGAIGGALGVFAWAAWRKMLNFGLLDLCAVPLALGYAIGRIGCQLSGDGDYGEPWDGPWAMAYPDGTVPTTEEVHPTPVYEALAMTAVAYSSGDCATAGARACSSPSTWCSPASSASWSSSCAATTWSPPGSPIHSCSAW